VSEKIAIPEDLKRWYEDTKIVDNAWGSRSVAQLIERIAALTAERDALKESAELSKSGWETCLHNLIDAQAEVARLSQPVSKAREGGAWIRRFGSNSYQRTDRGTKGEVMNEGTTHWEGCWQDRKHYECALARIERLTAQLADLQWTPITETNLPKVGDEVLLRDSKYWVEGVSNPDANDFTLEHWQNLGVTHFRPINAPKEGK
jgi:hypothetical protein